MEASTINTVDEYLAALPDHAREPLQKLRALILNLVPGVQENISYRMPAYKYCGILIYFAAFTHHYGLYFDNNSVRKLFTVELEEYELSTGTIRITFDKPFPDDLITKIIKVRMEENEIKYNKKKKPKNKPRGADIYR